MEVTYLLLATSLQRLQQTAGTRHQKKRQRARCRRRRRRPMPRSNLLRRRGSRPQIVNESDASVATEILYGVVTELQASSRGVPLRSCIRRASLKLYEDVIALTPFADEVRFLD